MYAQVVMWFDHEPVPIFPTQGGVNAFHACVANGHLVVAKYLAPKMEGHLFDPDDGGSTVLHWAAQKCQFPIVEYLVRSCGFDVKARDKVSHESPLYLFLYWMAIFVTTICSIRIFQLFLACF